MLPVRIHLDYIDPGSFLMDRRLAEVEASAGLAADRLPWEVRRPPEAILDARDPAWTAYWEEMARQAASGGVELTRPRVVPWTRKAHELALFARERGCFDKLHRALMDGFHLDGLDLGRVDVLVEVARSAGLELTETKAVLDVDRYAGELDRIRTEAEAAGIRGVPTLARGDTILEGVHDPDTIRRFLTNEPTNEQED